MNTLIIGNQTAEQRRDAILRAVRSGKAESAAHLDFESLDDAWHLLSDKRRGILKAMAGSGPLAIREVARRVGRDVRAVHSDVQRLLRAGVINRSEDGRVTLPYDTIRFEFTFAARHAA